MKSLDQIGIEQQTDKASQFTRTYAKPHDYLRHMERFFEPFHEQPVKLVEIGVGGGESIRTWLEYFPNAKVFGVDTTQGTNPCDTAGSGIHPRYTFTHGDQEDPNFWSDFTLSHGPFDIVIDDGSHYAKHIITTLNCLWLHLTSGGIYIIEDLNTAYGGAPFTEPGQPTQMDLVKTMLDSINREESQIERLHFSRELVIIKKV